MKFQLQQKVNKKPKYSKIFMKTLQLNKSKYMTLKRQRLLHWIFQSTTETYIYSSRYGSSFYYSQQVNK